METERVTTEAVEGWGKRGVTAAKSQLTRRFDNTTTHIWYENYRTQLFRVCI